MKSEYYIQGNSSDGDGQGECGKNCKTKHGENFERKDRATGVLKEHLEAFLCNLEDDM